VAKGEADEFTCEQWAEIAVSPTGAPVTGMKRIDDKKSIN